MNVVSGRSRTTQRVVVVLMLAAGLLVAVAPTADAAPRCFGREATIVGTLGDDEMVGTPDDDVIVGLDGWDTIRGVGGDDMICGGNQPDVIIGGGGNDRIRGGGGSDTLRGGRGDDRLFAERGSVEALFGGRGNDHLDGGPGSFDGLIGGPGDDVMDGGGGLDLAEFWDSPAPIEADLETDTAIGHGTDTIVAIEGLVGSNFDDVLLGDDGSNLLVGQDGDDDIRGRGSGTLAELGADVLDPGPGDDFLVGGTGADIVTYEDSPTPVVVDLPAGVATGWGADSLSGIEAIIGSPGDDTLVGDGRDNAIAGGDGDDAIDGGSGADQVGYFDARAPVVVDLELGIATGWGSDTLQSVEDLTGSAFADLLVGDDGANRIEGGSSDDSLVGSGGADVLIGDGGADQADGGVGDDACQAEVELGCESDPVASVTGLGRLAGWARASTLRP